MHTCTRTNYLPISSFVHPTLPLIHKPPINHDETKRSGRASTIQLNIKSLWRTINWWHEAHLTDEDADTQRRWGTCSKPPGHWGLECRSMCRCIWIESSCSFHAAKMFFQWPNEGWETTHDKVPTYIGFTVRSQACNIQPLCIEIKVLLLGICVSSHVCKAKTH